MDDVGTEELVLAVRLKNRLSCSKIIGNGQKVVGKKERKKSEV